MFTFWCLLPLLADGIPVITQDGVAAAHVETTYAAPTDGDPEVRSLSGFT